MKIFVKKFLGLLVSLVLLLAPMQVSAAATYFTLMMDTQAVVLQVVDGDALRVRPVGSNQVSLVRLAGINAQGRRDAQDFMAGALLGRTVQIDLSADTSFNPRFNDRWVPVYLTYNNVVYNRALVQRGLAVVDPEYRGHWLHSSLVSDQNRAESLELGLWTDDGFRTQYVPDRLRSGVGVQERVNINTASASQINNVLNIGRGSAIVRDRNRYYYFEHVNEVRGILTRAEFEEHWFLMKVATDINTASVDELVQLIGISASAARDIIDFREDEGPFTDLYELVEEELMSERDFAENYRFMSLEPVSEITLEGRSDLVLNVNDATVGEWMDLPGSMSRSFANELVREARRWPFRTWGDLRAFFYEFGQEDLYYRVRRFLVLE